MTEHRNLGMAFQTLVKATAGVTGIEFFRVLVRELATSLGFRYALVSKVTGAHMEHARTVAVWAADRFGDDFGYDLAGTPCEEVSLGEFCFYEDSVCEKFPEDRILMDLEGIAYTGAPLRDSSGKVIGILAAVHDQPVPASEDLKSIFETFASRAGVELERLSIQQLLAESEKRFRSLLESGNDLILAVDRDGKIQYVSPSSKRFSGYEPEEIVGKSAFGFVPVVDREMLLNMLCQAVERPEPGPLFETKILRKDGEWIDVESRANQIYLDPHTPGLVINCRDISERKRTEARLRFGKLLLETQSECSPDGVIVIARDGKILHSNRLFGEIWKLERFPELEENAESIWRQIEPQLKEAEEIGRGLRALGEDSDRTFHRTLSLNDGRTVECYSAAVRHHSGAVFGRFWSCRDITTHARLQERVQHSQRLECIGAVAAGIAHEFRNVLGPILGNAELASMDIPADNPAHKWNNQIIKSTKAARELVQQILMFGRQAPAAQSILSIGDVVTDGVRMLRVAIPRSVEIDLAIAPGLPPALMDSNQVHQVIINLGINAWQAMETGKGQISISVDLAAVDETVDPELPGGRYLRLQISDTGKGMDAETLQRLFEPFFTTKSAGEGTGLGLSMVHGIVKSHKGVIHVTSSPGEGTTFEIYLPPVMES